MRAAIPWAALAASLLAAAAQAQTYTVRIQASRPDLRGVASAGFGETLFRIDAASGTVTKVSGGGARLVSSTTRAQVTVRCSGSASCDTLNVNVAVGGIGGASGRAGSLSNFNVAMGTAVLVAGPTGSDPANFTIGPVGKGSSKTFFVGADFPILGDDSGQPSGAAATSFYAYAAPAPSAPSSGAVGSAVATVSRQLTLGSTADLRFGRIVRPAVGSGTVTIDPQTGDRSLSGLDGLSTPAPGAAVFLATGEGGQQISIDVPGRVDLVGPTDTLALHTDKSFTGTQTLSGSLGGAGTYAFMIGGSMTLNKNTGSGAYSAPLVVTVSYN